jgi:hypothetical protein
MYNKIWFWALNTKALIKEAIGLKLTDFERFIIEIGLY